MIDQFESIAWEQMILISRQRQKGTKKGERASESERSNMCPHWMNRHSVHVSANKDEACVCVTMAAFSRALHKYFILLYFIDLLIKFKCNSVSKEYQFFIEDFVH